MANTLTNVNPEIIAQEAFEAFKSGLTALSAFSTSFGAEAAEKGASIRVPVVTGLSATTSAFSTYESGDTTIAGTQVNISTHVRTPYHLTDTESSKTSVDVMMAQARESAYATAKSVWQGVTDLFVAGTFGDVEGTSKLTVTAANYDADDLATAISYLKKRNALGPITAIHDLDYSAALTKDNAVQSANNLGSDAVIRDGVIGRLLGADVAETNSFSSTLTGENTGVILAVPSACACAIRPIAPQDGAAEAGLFHTVITDPDSGLSMGFRQWYNTATGAKWAATEVLYGAAAVQAAGAVRVVSA